MTRALRRRETGGPADADVAEPRSRARARWPSSSAPRALGRPRAAVVRRGRCAADARASTASCRSSLSASPSSCAPGSARIRNERAGHARPRAHRAQRRWPADARRSQRLQPERTPEGRRPAHQPRRRARRQRPQAPGRARGRVAVGRDGRACGACARRRAPPSCARSRTACPATTPWAGGVGGPDFAREVLVQLVGPERADEIIGARHARSPRRARSSSCAARRPSRSTPS